MIPRRRRLAVGLGLMAGAWAAMAGPAAAGAGDVVVIGDSLLTLSTDELQPKLRNLGWTAHIDGVNGSGLTVETVVATREDWQAALAQAEEAYDPGVVVIVLGTNDAEPANRGEPYDPLLESLLTATDAPRVLWANCSTNTAVAERNRGCRIINGQLDAKATERRGFEVIRYDEEVVDDPNFDSPDSVHPGAYAQRDFAQLIADTIGPK